MEAVVAIDKIFGSKVEQFAVLECVTQKHNKVYFIMIVKTSKGIRVMRFWAHHDRSLGWKIEKKLQNFDAMIDAKMNKKDQGDSYTLVNEDVITESFENKTRYFEYVRQVSRIIFEWEAGKIPDVSRAS
jgi:hypothetical protein